MATDITQQLALLQTQRQELEVAELLILEKGIQSSDPRAVVAAQKQIAARLQDVAPREATGQKAYILNPQELLGTGSGYREKQTSYQLDYTMLRRMGRTPLIRSIIDTRIEQVAAFAVPQSTRYATGFRIVKKKPWGSDKEPKLSTLDHKTIEYITNFILNCGAAQNQWHGDDFDGYLRKVSRDSLEIDQDGSETVRQRNGKPFEFLAIDGATLRFAEDAGFDEQLATERAAGLIRLGSGQSKLPMLNGYKPTIVQVLDGQIAAEFYPWEMCMGIRNLRTDSSLGGYGISELEDLVTVVTAMLDADAYNRNFFKLGSAPKGFLKVKGQVAKEKLQEFRQEWRMMMAGVQNSHRTPVLPDDVDWVNLGQTNRDMEYSVFNEYLLKLCCSMYKIDPEEIGFKTGTGADGAAPAFEGNNAARLKYSRDKGLYPLLKYRAAKINKYIVNAIDPSFELQFVGLDALTEADELEQDIKRLGAYMTFNEIRQRRGLEPVVGGEIIANSIYQQYVTQQQQAQQQQQMGPGGIPGDGGNPSAQGPGNLTDPTADGGEDDNPFLKSFNNNLAIFD